MSMHVSKRMPTHKGIDDANTDDSAAVIRKAMKGIPVIHTRVDMCVGMRVDMCVDMRVDIMCVGKCAGMSRHALVHLWTFIST